MATATRDQSEQVTGDEETEGQMTEDTAVVDEPTEVEDDGPHVVVLGMSVLGGLGELLTDMPNDVKEMLAKALEEAKLRRLAEEIHEWVSPEIADAVLYCYGDLDGTTQPSLADAAMINLMRTAFISDEHMLMHLNEVEHFHGYVIAIMFLAEKGPEGLHTLREIAGLPVPDEPAETETETAPDA